MVVRASSGGAWTWGPANSDALDSNRVGVNGALKTACAAYERQASSSRGKPATARMNASKTKSWPVVRSIAYGVIVLLGVAVALPSFVKSRWSSSGVPVAFQFTVVDALTGLPIPGAKALVYVNTNWTGPINTGSVGHISATTDANGDCKVHSHFPGGGRGDKARLRVNSTIWIRADGYEPWQQPSATLLGTHLTVSHPFSRTNSYPVKVRMKRK